MTLMSAGVAALGTLFSLFLQSSGETSSRPETGSEADLRSLQERIGSNQPAQPLGPDGAAADVMAAVEENSPDAANPAAVKGERQRSSREGRRRRPHVTQLVAWRQSLSRGFQSRQLHRALILAAGAVVAVWGLRHAFRKCLTSVTRRNSSLLAASSHSGSERNEQVECADLREFSRHDTENSRANVAPVAALHKGLFRNKYFLSLMVLIVAIVAAQARSSRARRRWRYQLPSSRDRLPVVRPRPVTQPPTTTQLPPTTPQRFPVVAVQGETVFLGIYWVQDGNRAYNGGEPIEFRFGGTLFVFYLSKQTADLLKKHHMLMEVTEVLSQSPVKSTVGGKPVLRWGYQEDAKFTFSWRSHREKYEVSLPLETMYPFMPPEEFIQKAALEDLQVGLKAVTTEIAKVNEHMTVALYEDSEQSWWNKYFLANAPPYEQIIAASALGTDGKVGYPAAHHFVETNGGMGCIIGRGLENARSGLRPGFTFVRVPFDDQRNLYMFISQQADEALKAGGHLRTFVEAMRKAPERPTRWPEGWVVYWGKDGLAPSPPDHKRANILYKTRIPSEVTRAFGGSLETLVELGELVQAAVQEFARLHLHMTIKNNVERERGSRSVSLS